MAPRQTAHNSWDTVPIRAVCVLLEADWVYRLRVSLWETSLVKQAEQTLCHDRRHPSCLILPVVP